MKEWWTALLPEPYGNWIFLIQRNGMSADFFY